MSFVGDIFSGITHAIGSVFGIGGSIVKGISGALTDTGIASLVTTIGTLTSSIDTVVTNISDALGGIVGPIKDVVGSVSTLANDIQNKIVGPIITPITTTITEIDGLTKTISRLTDEGISGILKIPGAIADALTGVSAAWDRATRQLADANGQIVSQTLVPGFKGFIEPGLTSISDASVKFSTPHPLEVDRLHPVSLSTANYHDYLTKLVGGYIARFKDPKTWQDQIGSVIYDLLYIGPYIIGTLEALVEEAKAEARASNPTSTLSPGDIQGLYQRNVLTADEATNELLHNGFDKTRSAALLELTQWLPQLDRAVDWWARGIIDQKQFAKIVSDSGGNDADALALQTAKRALISPGTLVDWLARGIIDQVSFDDQLRAQGYDKTLVEQYIKGSVATASVGSCIGASGNELAGLDNWFPNTYASKPPPDVVTAGKAARLDDIAVQKLWTEHWNALPIQTAVTLFFRGEMNRHEVEIVVAQNNFPPEMTNMLIAAQSELIYPRSVPALVARGAMSKEDGITILKERGYSDHDAQLLVDDALAVAKGKTKATPTEATKLTVAELGSAFDDGLIDETAYRHFLGLHGVTGNDLEITVGMRKYAHAKAAKKATADTIKAEVALGVLTVDEAVQQLYKDGFSNDEVQRLESGFRQEKRKAAKVPDLSVLTQLFKNELIDQAKYLAGIQALGYNAPWDQLLVDLEVKKLNAQSASNAASRTAGAAIQAGG